MKKRAIAFDLDGTLLDTLRDIGEAMNTVLVEFGFPPHPLQSYRQFVGGGMKVLTTRSLPTQTDVETIRRCERRMQQIYAESWNRHSRPYPGIPRLLDCLMEQQVALAILSNKPDGFTNKCAAELLSDWSFGVVQGARDGTPKKPDPAALLQIVHQLGIPATQWLYVGDSDVDIQTGRNAQIETVGVSWGFRGRPELEAAGANHVIDQPSELIDLL